MHCGESKNVEFKAELPSKSLKYTKTAVAFANASGGKIIFGVEDGTGRVIGVDNDKLFPMMDTIVNAISDSCEPAIIPELTLQTIDGKTIIVAEIFPGKQRPYFIKALGINERTFVRVGGTTRLADAYLVKELLFEGANRCYDQAPCLDCMVTEAQAKELCGKIREAAERNHRSSGNVPLKEVTINTLLAWGVLAERNGTLMPSNAYALLTGTGNLHAKIQCAVFKGNNRSVFIDRREYTGALQEQMEEAYQFVLRNIRLGAEIDGLYRKDEYELPPSSIREVIANAVTHRSYLDPGNIQVALYDNRLEVTSPGMLMNGVTIEKIREGYSKIRNRAIASVFSYMGIIEQWGSGIPRLIEEIEKYGLPQPELIDLSGDFRVNLFRPRANGCSEESSEIVIKEAGRTFYSASGTKDGTEGGTEHSRTALVVLELYRNGTITQEQISANTGIPLRTVKRIMAALQKDGTLTRIGSARKGEWIITHHTTAREKRK